MSDEIDRATLLDGVDDELRDAANKALDAVDLLKMCGFPAEWVTRPLEESKPRVVRPFRVMSGHDIDGMTDLIEGYESTLRQFTPNMRADDPEELPELRRAYDLLSENWYGDGAEAATLYVANLSQAYQGSALLISEVAGGAIAAREIIATAREDLTELADTFYAAAEQYAESKKSNSPAWGRMAAWATVGVAVGLLTGGVAGVVGAVGGIAGSLIAGEVAKADAGSVAGDSADEVVTSYLEQADALLDKTTETAEELARKIDDRIGKISEHPIPPPPDVSPGPAFDPDDFRTDTLPGDIERNVRDANVDIAAGGGQAGSAGGGRISNRLAGGEDPDGSDGSGEPEQTAST
ncbi:hypothetical protein B1813_13085 [Saccharomonospora piscinae]|uniref:Uncharacterized protein n=1 Tax=Saccharomonospora piscinae TaxID=687388 RepID=A0A1V9A7C0_SACPI|nr:hypothetical protein [Saccharomonospora piscinae]OQO93029.1 hypothetical protein B1813_13085 [Saccharomonospora piscinae]